jgi:predicted transport protein
LADIKLFQMQADEVQELPAQSVAIEKTLQLLLERHLERFLGVRFIATEYQTGRTHGGRIDTLGLDDNDCPVIIEYKRALNENVISQGLYYLDWLMDHQGEFTLEVLKQFGQEVANNIDWSGPRLLCIAGDFTRYDEYAVHQIPRNIELLRYRRYGNDLLLLDLVNVSPAETAGKRARSVDIKKDNLQAEAGLEPEPEHSVLDSWEGLKAFLLALGDDVQMKELAHYIAFRRLKNFACVKVRQNDLQVWVRLDPASVELEEGFSRNVTHIGHLGTGNVEIRIHNTSDLERAKSLLLRSYQES